MMQEFYVAATKKLRADALIAKDILHRFERFEIVLITPEIIKDAIDCSIINRISSWDSLIVVTAESARCARLWTEDLNNGQIIRGVRIEDSLICWSRFLRQPNRLRPYVHKEIRPGFHSRHRIFRNP